MNSAELATTTHFLLLALCTQQPAHDAEVLCLAYSPMMVPAYGGGRGATPPPRSPPDGSGEGLSGDEQKHGTNEARVSPAAEEGPGGGGSVGVLSSSSSMFSASINSAGREGNADGAGVGGGAAMSVSSWEAVDALDPAGAAEKMLSLSFMSSLQSMTAPKVDGNYEGGVTTADGGSGGCGGGGGSVRSSADEQGAGTITSGVLGEGAKRGGLVAPPSVSTGGGWAHHRSDCGGAPLVLLASASRDRLVRIFDASLSSRGIRGPEAAALAATSASASLESGGVRIGGGAGGGSVAMRFGIEGAVEEPSDLGGSPTGKATVTSTGAGVGAETAAASGFPLLKTLDSHSGSVTAVKFTKDGKRCVLDSKAVFGFGFCRGFSTIFSQPSGTGFPAFDVVYCAFAFTKYHARVDQDTYRSARGCCVTSSASLLGTSLRRGQARHGGWRQAPRPQQRQGTSRAQVTLLLVVCNRFG